MRSGSDAFRPRLALAAAMQRSPALARDGTEGEEGAGDAPPQAIAVETTRAPPRLRRRRAEVFLIEATLQ
jgi:hypothetical protein